jgi:hypothetical protein
MGFLNRLLGKPTIEEFGERFIRALKKVDPDNEYRHEPAEHRIICRRAGQKDSVINLGNLYETHLAVPRLQRAADAMDMHTTRWTCTAIAPRLGAA